MKKIITAILTVIMMLTATACFAEVGSDTFDMGHNIMGVWIDDQLHNFELYELTVENQVIYATYLDENSDYGMIIAMDSWLAADVYYAEEQDTDVMAFMLFENDGTTHYSSCHAPAVNEGNYSDFVLTVSDEDGWYQGGMIGYTISEESGEIHSVQAIFDFVIE